ncbi:hypothetical protein CRM93_14705, partial [Acetobacter fabarum]
MVVLSSIAAVRPRKFNSVYGATKAALDAFARGYADSLHGTGVRVLLVRPGFVKGRMTEGMQAAPLATTPEKVGAAVAGALRGQGRGDGKWEKSGGVFWLKKRTIGSHPWQNLSGRPPSKKRRNSGPQTRPAIANKRRKKRRSRSTPGNACNRSPSGGRMTGGMV